MGMASMALTGTIPLTLQQPSTLQANYSSLTQEPTRKQAIPDVS